MESQQCRAKCKATGQQCKRRVIGASVCVMHGQNSRTKAKRARAISLAEALAADPRRRPDEILLDVMHQSDHLLRRAREEIANDRLTVETMAKLVELQDRAGKWAGSTLAAGVQERQVRLAEQQGALVADCIQRILDALMLSDVQWARVGTVVPAEVRRLTAIPS